MVIKIKIKPDIIILETGFCFFKKANAVKNKIKITSNEIKKVKKPSTIIL